MKFFNFIQKDTFQDDVAPTDSRLRPDMRMMENGDWDGANQEKGRLEEKQRIDTKKYQVFIIFIKFFL